MKDFKFLRRPKVAAAAAALALGLGGLGIAAVERPSSPNPPATFRYAPANEETGRSGFAPVVKRVLPAVVNISSSKVVKTPGMGELGPMSPFFQQFFGGAGGSFNAPSEQREQGLGSGVIVSPQGYILTNNHVIDGATDIRVGLWDKREFPAKVVGADPKSDIAVLRIDAPDLTPIVMGDSSKVQVGDYALAVGDPFGVGKTVTMGIVSATKRANLGIEDYEEFIQTDAAINPGNSGGALVNDRGELIGINTAILSHGSEGNQGIGFAIPIDYARQVMDQLVSTGKVTRAYIGIAVQDVTPELAKDFGAKNESGALVGDVQPNSPAQKIGLQKGDIVLELDGKPVNDSNDLRMRISMMKPDAVVRLEVLRSGAEREFTATLGEMPTQQASANSGAAGSGSSNALNGISVEDLTPQNARQLGIPANTPGVVVTAISPSSPAADSGLQPGDVIQEVNRHPVRNTAEFESAVRSSKGSSTLLLVDRGGSTLFVAV